MNISGSNFQIKYGNDNTFHIEENIPSKTKDGIDSFFPTLKVNKFYQTALDNLKNINEIIEKIANNEFTYDKSYVDEYANLTKTDLVKKLQEKAREIDESFNVSTSKLNWLIKLIFKISSKQKQIHTTQEKIKLLFQTTSALPTVDDHIQLIANFLPLKEVGVLRRINLQGQLQAKQATINRARKYGYEGFEYEEAKEYLGKLAREMKKNNIVPRDYTISETLNRLDSFKKEDILTHLNAKITYRPDFFLFRKCLIQLANLELEDLKKTSAAKKSALKDLSTEALGPSIFFGDKAAVEVLLKYGADPNKGLKDDGKEVDDFPLHLAVKKGNISIAELLLRSGAKIDIQLSDGETPLLIACGSSGPQSNFAMAEFLLKHGANPNAVEKFKNAPLVYAALQGDVKMVELLLKSGAKINQVNIERNSALAIACNVYSKSPRYKANPEVINLLLDKGADPNIVNEHGFCCLYYAIKYANNTDIEKALLSRGAKIQ